MSKTNGDRVKGKPCYAGLSSRFLYSGYCQLRDNDDQDRKKLKYSV